MNDSNMPYDATAAKRYVLRELMDEMDKAERKKLKDSFQPDSEPWKIEQDTHNSDMHDDLAGKMLSGKVEQPSDDEPVADSINEYSRKRFKK